MAARRYGTIIRHLSEDPDTCRELCEKLPDDVLIELGAAIRIHRKGRGGGAGGGRRAEEADADTCCHQGAVSKVLTP